MSIEVKLRYSPEFIARFFDVPLHELGEATPTEAPDEAIPSPEERPDLGNPDRRDTPVTEPSGGSGG